MESEEALDAVHPRIRQMQTGEEKRMFTNGGGCGDVEIPVEAPTKKEKEGSSSAAGQGSKPLGQGDDEVGFDLTFLRRFFRLHSILFLKLNSLSVFLFLFLLAVNLLQEYVVYRVGLIPSGFYKVLSEKDLSGFYRQVYTSLGIILAVAFTKSTNQYVQKLLTVTWRQLLTRALHRQYFTDIRYYQLNVLDKSVDNPDQRITQDVDKFCTNYCEILPRLIVSPFVISYYWYQAHIRSGWQGPLACFGFFFITTIINKLIMSPIVRYVVKQEECEGDFRFVHMLVRVNSESIAFLNASGVEAAKTNDALDKLIKVQHRLYLRQAALNFSINFTDYLGSIVSYLMLAVPLFSGRYDDLAPSDLSALISQNSFVLMYLIYTFTQLMSTSAQFVDIAGVVHRISQLIERLNALGDFWKDLFPEDFDQRTSSSLDLYDEWARRRNDRRGENSTAEKIPENGFPASDRQLPAVVLKNVTFSAPLSTLPLVTNLSMSFCVGESVLVVGHSSAGKSSLLRILRGLWPHTDGTISKYYPPGPQGVLYCPQKPYLTIGSLRDQVCFPLKSSGSSTQEDNLIIHYLSLLKMKTLLERVGGLDVPIPWTMLDSLSPGEMQRIAFIRVFFHHPLLAILDEATSALPLEMEHLVYSECKRLGITTISVGHRASLREYHDKVLSIGHNGQWRLDPIVPAYEQSSLSSQDVVS